MIQDLDPSKVHGQDMTRIRMLNIYGESMSKPLEIFFNITLKTFSFLMKGKKASLVPVHAKVCK